MLSLVYHSRCPNPKMVQEWLNRSAFRLYMLDAVSEMVAELVEVMVMGRLGCCALVNSPVDELVPGLPLWSWNK